MSLKLSVIRLLKINLIFIMMFSFLLTSPTANAQFSAGAGFQAQAGFGGGFGGQEGYGGAGYGGQGQWGSGMWGGQQQCAYPQRVASGSYDISDDEKELKVKISSLKSEVKKRETEKKKHDKAMASARTRLEKIFDGEVLDFLLDVHIQNDNQCTDYKDFKGTCDPQTGMITSQKVNATGEPAAEVKSNCKAPTTDVPSKLAKNWNSEKMYCAANSKADQGKINPAICSDETLRPDGKRSIYSTSDCSKYLSEYRKNRVLSENVQNKINRANDDLEVSRDSIPDVRERAKLDREERLRTETESEPCAGCDEESRTAAYKSPKRDWAGIGVNLFTGLFAGALGYQTDKARWENQAQRGDMPDKSYAATLQYGLGLGGSAAMYGLLGGNQGQGAFGCAGRMGMGMGNGAYGPYGPQGAFGYPQNMFGSPWGGGMYQPGMFPGGGMAGPNGGFPGGMNGGYAINGMLNGGLMMNGGGYMSGNMQGGYMGQGMMNGNMQGGYIMSGGGMQAGYMSQGMMNGGYPMSGGLAMNGGGYMGQGMMNGNMQGGYMAQAMMNSPGSYMNSPQYLQMQQQMQQQQMQMQQQYYQAQMQQQMQAYQRQQAIQQQAVQVQQEIANLQMRLQMLYSGGSFSGGNGSGGYYGVGTGGGTGGSYGSAAPTPGSGYQQNTNVNNQQPYNPNNGGQPYNPGTGGQPYNPGNGGSQVTIPSGR